MEKSLSSYFPFTNDDRALWDVAGDHFIGRMQDVLHRNFMAAGSPCMITQQGLDAALWKAGVNGRVQNSNMLLEFGGDIQVDRDARLAFAAAVNDLDEMEKLIDAGADIHFRDEFALLMALFYRRPEAAGILVHRGADMWVATRNKFIMSSIESGGKDYEPIRNFIHHILNKQTTGQDAVEKPRPSDSLQP